MIKLKKNRRIVAIFLLLVMVLSLLPTDIVKLEKVDAYEYARQFGQTEIANYLKSKLDEK